MLRLRLQKWLQTYGVFYYLAAVYAVAWVEKKYGVIGAGIDWVMQ